MPGDEITGLSLDDVRKLIDDKKLPQDILDKFNLLFGAVIAVSPVVAGPAALPLLATLEPVSALVEAGKAAIKRLTRPGPADYVDQARRFAAANTLLTYTAFFDALRLRSPDLIETLGVTGKRKRRAHLPAAGSVRMDVGSVFTDRIIQVPHPVNFDVIGASRARSALYTVMAEEILNRYSRELKLPEERRTELGHVLGSDFEELAESVYQAEFLGMAVDHQPFFVWSVFQHQAATDERLRQVRDELRSANDDNQLRFELVGSAVHGLDRGLDHLGRAIAGLPWPDTDGPRQLESAAAKAVKALRRRWTWPPEPVRPMPARRRRRYRRMIRSLSSDMSPSTP